MNIVDQSGHIGEEIIIPTNLTFAFYTCFKQWDNIRQYQFLAEICCSISIYLEHSYYFVVETLEKFPR